MAFAANNLKTSLAAWSYAMVNLQYKGKTKLSVAANTGKNNGFPFLDILGYLKNTHKNPKFGKVRQVPTMEFPTKFPDWDLSPYLTLNLINVL